MEALIATLTTWLLTLTNVDSVIPEEDDDSVLRGRGASYVVIGVDGGQAENNASGLTMYLDVSMAVLSRDMAISRSIADAIISGIDGQSNTELSDMTLEKIEDEDFHGYEIVVPILVNYD